MTTHADPLWVAAGTHANSYRLTREHRVEAKVAAKYPGASQKETALGRFRMLLPYAEDSDN